MKTDPVNLYHGDNCPCSVCKPPDLNPIMGLVNDAVRSIRSLGGFGSVESRWMRITDGPDEYTLIVTVVKK